MRIHRILAEACVEILEQVFDDGQVLDRVVSRAFRANPKWGKRDRNFVAESVWEVVRWRRALEFVAGSAEVRSLLSAEWRRQGFDLPDWWEWQGSKSDEMVMRECALASQPRAIRESIPDWLDQLGASELGEHWDPELTALNRRAPVFLRVNRLLTTKAEAIDWLTSEGVEVAEVDDVRDALVLPQGKLLPKRLVQDGRVEIQDAGSQMVASILGVEPGMRVVDACAGAGGKTLQLSAEMEGLGEILALDVAPRKLVELKRRAGRASVRNARIEEWGKNTLKSRLGWADRVLVDAPCSGLGTIRRQPDLKWRLGSDSLESVKDLQSRILENCLEFLKPDGKLVYATCSILPSENEEQIEELLSRDSRWLKEDELKVHPSERGWDGIYACLLSRRV